MCSVPQSCLTLWTIAHQAPLSTGFFRKEYWSRLSFLPPGDLHNSDARGRSPAASLYLRARTAASGLTVRSLRAGETAPSLPPTTASGRWVSPPVGQSSGGLEPPPSRPLSALSGLPDHPSGPHPSQGLVEEHRCAVSVRIPRYPHPLQTS